MNLNMTNTKICGIALCALGLVVAGCDVGDKDKELTRTPPIKIVAPKPAAEAGLEATVDASPQNDVAKVALTRNYGYRADAFALLPVERMFDRNQTTARLMSEGGGYQNLFVAPDEVAAVAPISEPPPAWRLSGVVISDGVAALLDMGGKVIDIHPGMKIPDTEWTVVSIDSERAVLRRDNGKIPRMFAVPLQSGFESPSGGGNSGRGGSTGGGGKLGGGTGGAGVVGGD